jgi:hypothetical protein
MSTGFDEFAIPGWRRQISGGVGMEATFEHLPVYEETCAALGVKPVKTIVNARLIEVSFVHQPADPHTFARLLDGITKT